MADVCHSYEQEEAEVAEQQGDGQKRQLCFSVALLFNVVSRFEQPEWRRYNATMAASSSSRPVLQFSLQSLLILTAMACIGLAFYRLGLGSKVAIHYCFLIFAVGPWFAYLASECLPIRASQLRTAAANMILLALFVATLKLAEWHLPGPVAVVVAVAAVVLWTPQYMIFFVWRMGD